MSEEIKNTVNNNIETENNSNGHKHLFKRKQIALKVSLILGILGVVFGIIYYIHSITYVSTDDAFIESHIIQISPKVSGIVKNIYVNDNQIVKRGDLLVEIDPDDYITALEQAQADLKYTESAKDSANINLGLTDITSKSVAFQADSSLRAAKSSLEVAQDQVELSRARLTQAKATVEQAKSGLEIVKSQINSYTAQSELASSDVERNKVLYDQKLISKQQMDNVVTNYIVQDSKLQESVNAKKTLEYRIKALQAEEKTAEMTLKQSYSQLNEAKSRLNEALGKFNQLNTSQQQIDISKLELDQAKYKIEQLKAKVKQAELQLSYTKIYAPESGHITKKAVEVGTLYQVGQPFFAIVPDKVWIIANFKENQIEKMRPGQKVNIKVDTYPNKVFKGHVDSIQRGTGARFSLLPPENAVGSYVKVVQRIPVKILFDEKPDSKYLLVPGMSVVPEVKIR